jgi:biotin operon repressor
MTTPRGRKPVAMGSVVQLRRNAGAAESSLHAQVYQQIHNSISQGTLAPGTRLPSARALATELRVSRNTIDAAFAQLRAEGLIVRRVGSGTVVAPIIAHSTLRELHGGSRGHWRTDTDTDTDADTATAPDTDTAPDALLQRPSADEYAAYYANYIARVPAGDLISIMRDQIPMLNALLRPLSDAAAAHRYAPGKWSVRQVVGHLTDTERVFSFRAAVFASGDRSPLPGFDQDLWVANGVSDARSLTALLDEWIAARRASIAMVQGMSAEMLLRRGIASGVEFSARAAAHVLPGHVAYHAERLRAEYLGR